MVAPDLPLESMFFLEISLSDALVGVARICDVVLLDLRVGPAPVRLSWLGPRDGK